MLLFFFKCLLLKTSSNPSRNRLFGFITRHECALLLGNINFLSLVTMESNLLLLNVLIAVVLLHDDVIKDEVTDADGDTDDDDEVVVVVEVNDDDDDDDDGTPYDDKLESADVERNVIEFNLSILFSLFFKISVKRDGRTMHSVLMRTDERVRHSFLMMGTSGALSGL